MSSVSRRIGPPGAYGTVQPDRQPQRPPEYLRPAAPPPEQDADVLLRTTEVARQLQVSARTVLAWAQAGKLPSILTPGGHRRYPARGVEEVLAAMTQAGEQRGLRDLNL